MIEAIVLGSSCSIPTRDRNLPALLIKRKTSRVLFDCGEGTQRQLMIARLKFMRIDHVFITHWHADHFAGLLGLVQTMNLEGRERPLYVYGPRGTPRFVRRLLSIGYYDNPFEVMARTMRPGSRVVVDDGVTVRAYRTDHRVPSIGLVYQEEDTLHLDPERARSLGVRDPRMLGRLKEGEAISVNGKRITPEMVLSRKRGRKIVYTGDTRPTRETVKAARGADVLFHDATFASEHDRARETAHTTARDAARIAKEAGVKMLVLTHISRRYTSEKNSPRKLLEEAKKIFPNTVLAEDFLRVTLKRNGEPIVDKIA